MDFHPNDIWIFPLLGIAFFNLFYWGIWWLTGLWFKKQRKNGVPITLQLTRARLFGRISMGGGIGLGFIASVPLGALIMTGSLKEEYLANLVLLVFAITISAIVPWKFHKLIPR